MNIYTSQVPRLKVFEEISSENPTSFENGQHQTYFEGGYFYGDATAYELQLDRVLKQLSTGTIPQNCGIIYSNA